MSTFKKNTAVTGFPFLLVSATDGSAITSGAPTAYVTLDGGTQASVTASPVHEGNGQWSVDLTAGEMNGDVVGLLITLSGAIPVHFTIKTDTKLVSELNDLSAANVNAECDTALADYDAPTKAELDSGLATLNDLDAAGIRSAVGMASANLDTQLGTIDTNLDAVLVDTNELQTNQGDWATATGFATAAALATVDANVDAILADTDTTIPGLVAALNDLSAADVRSAVGLASANLDTQLAALPTANENADALLNRDMSAVSDTNARSPLNALRLLRNQWSVSGTTMTVYKEDDSTSAWTATLTADASANPVVGSDPA